MLDGGDWGLDASCNAPTLPTDFNNKAVITTEATHHRANAHNGDIENATGLCERSVPAGLSTNDVQTTTDGPIQAVGNNLPSISPIEDVRTVEDVPTGEILFTITDTETPAGELKVSVSSSQLDVIDTRSNSSFALERIGEVFILTLNSEKDAHGTATITVTVDDGMGGTATTSFLLEVLAEADQPILNAPDQVGIRLDRSPVALNIVAALSDNDGSELLTTIEITGVPAGATLSAGENMGGGRWRLMPSEINDLTLTPAADDDINFELSVSATATERSNPDAVAEVNGTIKVTFDRVGDTLDEAKLVSVVPTQATLLQGEGIDFPNDVDIYRLDFETAFAMVVSTSTQGLDGVLDTFLRLFDSDGIEIRNDDDAGMNTDSRIETLVLQPGTYYVGVSSFRNLSYEPTKSGSSSLGQSVGSYELSVSAIFFVPVRDLTDVNGDGRPDVVAANETENSISVWFGTESGLEQPNFTELAEGAEPASLTIGDFNNDGMLDVATANNGSNSVSILLGTHDKNNPFSQARIINVGDEPSFITSGDLNDDRNLDIVVTIAGSDNSIWVLLGKGTPDGDFEIAQKLDVGQAPRSVTIGDVDGDAKLDLAVANENSDNVSILFGNGDGTFEETRKDIDVGKGPTSITTADFNLDNVLDLAVANKDSNDVSILIHIGGRDFSEMRLPINDDSFEAIGPSAIKSEDFNKDGDPDLVTANTNSQNLSVLLGRDGAEFQLVGTVPLRLDGVAKSPKSFVIDDFDLDGNLDIAIVVSLNEIAIALGNGDGTFSDPEFFRRIQTSPRSGPPSPRFALEREDAEVTQSAETQIATTPASAFGSAVSARSQGTERRRVQVTPLLFKIDVATPDVPNVDVPVIILDAPDWEIGDVASDPEAPSEEGLRQQIPATEGTSGQPRRTVVGNEALDWFTVGVVSALAALSFVLTTVGARYFRRGHHRSDSAAKDLS